MPKHFIKLVISAALLLLLFAISSAAFFSVPSARQTTLDIHENQLVFKVNHPTEAERLAQEHHLLLISVSPRGVATFQPTRSTDIERLLEAGFAYNSLTHIVRPPWQRTEDPYMKDQYALEMMQTIEAWDITTGSSTVTVAIIDTGIDINHVEFENRISLLSYNASTNTVGLEAVIDDHGHGTMVAGIIGAIKDNGRGIAGIAQNVQLMVIKANEEDRGVFKDSALIEGIYYAADNGADIINLSLGGSYANPQTEAALAYAKNLGVIVVAAAGNSATSDPFYPAAFSSTLSISAVDEARDLASFSNFGSTIDLSAPGANIVTTVRNNGYGSVNGTSFAAPQIAGVLALMLSHFGPMPLDELTALVLLSAMDEGDPGRDDLYGHGIANTLQALTYELVTVTFETFAGTDLSPIFAINGALLTLPDDPVLKDHVFEGWYKDADFTQIWDEDTDFASEDLILYAKFNASYHNVHFITEGTPVESIIVERGELFVLPESTLDHHVFDGWTIDATREVFYEPAPLMSDLTLYAKFTPIVYHHVTLYVDGANYDTIIVRDGESYFPETLTKHGHDFDGWYLDGHYQTPYMPASITEDIALYARFIPHQYTITFMTSGTPIEPLMVNHGEIPELPESDKTDHTFIGWYLDEALTARYLSEAATDDLTLYARFADEAYLVTYIVDQEIDAAVWVEAGDVPYERIPYKRGHAFTGWYLDATFTTPYENTPVYEALTLYANFDILSYTVTYYDHDGITVLYQETVFAGDGVMAPEGPFKPSSQHFDYTFANWSLTSEEVFDNLDIFPVYDRQFIVGSVSLNPGVDTVNKGDLWQDAGTTLNDNRLTVTVTSPVNSQIPGLYTVTYAMFDNGILVHTLIRMVRITEKDSGVEIRLNPALTTLPVGGIYTETGATTTHGEIEIIGSVDTSKAGVYPIVYRVDFNGIIYEKTRFVHVYETQLNGVVIWQTFAKKEEGHYVV